MALALRQTTAERPHGVLRPLLALAAALILATGIVLAGGFQLPDQRSAADAVSGAQTAPVYDGRGKWTGY